MWSCIPTMPGMTVRPRASITRAPEGTGVAPSPIAWIRPPDTTTV